MKLRKKIGVITACLAVGLMVLAGCGKKQGSQTSQSNNAQAQNVAGTAAKRLSKVDSMQIKLSSQSTSSGKKTKDSRFNYNMDIAYTRDPDAMRINTIVKQGKKSSSLPVYMDDYDVYSQTGSKGSWKKSDAQSAGFDFDTQREEYSGITVLKDLKDSKKTKLVSGKKNYTLKYQGSGDDAADLVKQILGVGSPGNDSGMGAVIDSMNVKNLTYQIKLDKKTKLPESYYANVTLQTKSGKKATQKQFISGRFSHINDIEKIKLPQVK